MSYYRYRYTTIFYFLITLILGCSEGDESAPYLRVTGIQIDKLETHYLFASQPIYFSPALLPIFTPDGKFSVPAGKWTFGDGTESAEFTSTHTFAEGGSYTIQLTIDDGEKHYFDTTIIIHPSPILQREAEASEMGKFLFHNQNGGYQVLYSQGEAWKLQTISGDKKILNRKTLVLEASKDFSSMMVTNNGNLVGLDKNFWEIDMDGNVLHNLSVNPPNSITPHLTEYNDGLYFIRDDDGAKVVNLDSDRNATTISVPGTTKTEFEIVNGQFEPPDKIRLCYKHQNPSHSSIVWHGTITGEKISEDYNDYLLYRSFNLTDGYLDIMMLEEYSPPDYNYYKFSHQGESVPTFGHGGLGPYKNLPDELPIEVFNIDGFIYVFYGNMKGMKLDSNGYRIWEKNFTFPFDRLSSVIINNKQNFVLLGTHYQYSNDQVLSDEPTDLITVEIDKDANIVD